jgi:hypothetical protein
VTNFNISEELKLARPTSGADILKAVEEVVGNNSGNADHPRLYKNPRDRYGDRFSIGQYSSDQHGDLLVVPTRRLQSFFADYFQMTEMYKSIEVISYPLTMRARTAQRLNDESYTKEAVQQAVRSFAQKLRENSMVR